MLTYTYGGVRGMVVSDQREFFNVLSSSRFNSTLAEAGIEVPSVVIYAS
jgi:hypothetical protein